MAAKSNKTYLTVKFLKIFLNFKYYLYKFFIEFNHLDYCLIIKKLNGCNGTRSVGCTV